MTRKTWYLILGIFGALVPWNYFSSRDWTLGCISLQFWDFCNISLFPRIPSLQSFGNLWNNSYIKLLILYIRFHFTWGVNGTCTNTLQNFKILWTRLQLLLHSNIVTPWNDILLHHVLYLLHIVPFCRLEICIFPAVEPPYSYFPKTFNKYSQLESNSTTMDD